MTSNVPTQVCVQISKPHSRPRWQRFILCSGSEPVCSGSEPALAPPEASTALERTRRRRRGLGAGVLRAAKRPRTPPMAHAPDDSAAAEASCCGPVGPDGKPLFTRLPEFVAVYLVFASDILVRTGKLETKVFKNYLSELHDLNPTMADAYVQTAHCSVSFLTDTTTMKLMKQWLADSKISKNALYNIIIGQTVLPDWRRLEALGPFDVETPPTPEEFAERFSSAYPGHAAVVSSHLKKGVLGLLGKGKEIKSVGRLIHDMAAKIPAALERVCKGEALAALREDIGLPLFRTLLVLRILSIADSTLYDLNNREIGEYAQLGLWLLLGMPAEQSRAAVLDTWTNPVVDPLFAKLVEVLPDAIADKDRHGIINRLDDMNIAPLCAQNIEHMLCEFRKMALPAHRAASGERYEGYADLWHEVAYIIARRK